MEQVSKLTAQDLLAEISFTTSRSGGPGGQNVNKVNSKVILKFDLVRSSLLKDDEKFLITRSAGSKITKDGVLVLSSQEKRSQLENKEEVMAKFNQLLMIAFTPRKKRKATKPKKAAIQKRISDKKQASQKKQWRQKPE